VSELGVSHPKNEALEDADETLTRPPERGGVWRVRVLGDRYGRDRMLGRWPWRGLQAYDLKLCVEVALNALSPTHAGRGELLRPEVRAARQVMSPNVCRIYGLVVELLAKLDALTNLRLVPDPSASTGWKLDVGPFPGWKEVVTW